jgi:hypothetical protein
MARDLNIQEMELLLTLMLVKQQQLSVFFFYTGKSHKIGEVHDGATMDWMAQEKEVLQLHLQLLVLGIFLRQGEALPEHCRITLILILQDTLILL